MVLKSTDPSLVEALKSAVIDGKIVLLTVEDSSTTTTTQLSDQHKILLSRLLRKEFKSSCKDDSGLLFQWSDESDILVHPNLQIYLVIHSTIKSVIKSDGSMILSPFLSSLGIHDILQFSITDMELKKRALENIMQDFVLSHERPEYQISHRSLLADLSLHQQELEVQQGKMLKYTLAQKSSDLLLVKDLMDTISKNEAAEVAASEQVREATKNLQMSDQQVLAYRPFSHWAGLMLTNIQKVSSVFQYFNLSVAEFQEILVKVIHEFKGTKVADHMMSIKAHVIHLKNELLFQVYQKLQVN